MKRLGPQIRDPVPCSPRLMDTVIIIIIYFIETN
jgi:hypothetical protein